MSTTGSVSVTAYVSVLPDAVPQRDQPIVSWEPRWYGRLLIRLSDRLRDFAYVGAVRKETRIDDLRTYDGGFI